jgi:hypothetical protein
MPKPPKSAPIQANSLSPRTGVTASPLTVKYTIAGTAEPGTDYGPLPGVGFGDIYTATIPAGASSTTVTVTAKPTTQPRKEDKSVSVYVLADPNYAAPASTAPATTQVVKDPTIALDANQVGTIGEFVPSVNKKAGP